MLISNALSVAILQWCVMPALNILLRPWLQAESRRRRALSIGGTLVIVLLLTGMAILLQRFAG
jgi:hypothetical protein